MELKDWGSLQKDQVVVHEFDAPSDEDQPVLKVLGIARNEDGDETLVVGVGPSFTEGVEFIDTRGGQAWWFPGEGLQFFKGEEAPDGLDETKNIFLDKAIPGTVIEGEGDTALQVVATYGSTPEVGNEYLILAPQNVAGRCFLVGPTKAKYLSLPTSEED